jgi:hypothetical protein
MKLNFLKRFFRFSDWRKTDNNFSIIFDGPPVNAGLIVAVQTKELLLWSNRIFSLCCSEDFSFLAVFAIIVIKLLLIEKSERREILLSAESLLFCEINKFVGEVI